MMEEIISLFFQCPLFVQVLILGIVVIILALLIIVTIFHKRIGVESIWFIKFPSAKIKEELEQSNKQLEESRNTTNDLNQEIGELKKKLSELPGTVELPELPGRYFIGIDIGRDKIDYCLVDYDRFLKGGYGKAKVKEGTSPTPDHFKDIYPRLGEIVQTLSQEAADRDRAIDGIGLGLPGQVDPRRGLLLKSPGFDDVDKEPVIEEFSECLSKEFPIEIDNDVRCATRYVWKQYSYEDVICIFVGMGLGSGIVLGGKMLYGCNFTAGEIGHTTISEKYELVEKEECKCGLKGCYHWEMYVSSHGMMNIARNLESEEYKRLRTNYETIIQGAEYQRLLKQEAFSKHSDKHFVDYKKEELTTYFLSLAFYAGEEYAAKVVKEFIRYLAIGIANYINVINPERVYLGGGMIRGFYGEKNASPCLGCTTEVLLRNEMKKYALPSASDVVIVKRDYKETRIASIGAALILKDKSYFDYKKRRIKSLERHNGSSYHR
ncbi:N-acetyl-D-glucosamine kinase [subsurface metagenome]